MLLNYKIVATFAWRIALWEHKTSRHVPLVPVICIVTVLFVSVIVPLTVLLYIREPCSSCKPCGYSAPCEEDWIWYRGKCYYFSETYDEWNNSQNFCASHNASLSLIDSQEELDFLRRHKGLYDHWIGLYRDIDGPAWVWANGSLFRNTFRIEEDYPCVYLNNNRIGSTECRVDKKWICNKIDANITYSNQSVISFLKPAASRTMNAAI
ncbi:hypothetical protein XELAEV_18034305mg [Xenopus laevis]|uniref:C-type lectin domain-containing protein n=1 Tax=Xenopus laevis TaxID=8355 RepID=A0A974HBD8_XENLA|nr:hypothetical protein XELAEV_18034305mg [Xenopus laevis]